MDLFAKTAGVQIYDTAKEKGVYPYFHELCSGQNTVVDMEGKKTGDLGLFSYNQGE